MQRIALLVLTLTVGGQGRAVGQQVAGSMLWRLAATTLPVPPALALGAVAAFWNPAQVPTTDSGSVASPKMQLAFEAIQTPSAVDAGGMIATIRVPAGRLGQVGVIYGRVGLSDVTQTLDSPDPTGATIPVYTFAIGATWSRRIAGTNFGLTVASHETRLDQSRVNRWTVDVGASRGFADDRFRAALATHFLSALRFDDPSQDFYGGVEVNLWQGSLAGERQHMVVRGRYGLAFGHGFTADHEVGLG